MIDFLRYRYVCLFFSGLLFAGAFGAYFYHGGLNYHIDFAGGMELRVNFDAPVAMGDIRHALTQEGYQDPVIQSLGNSGTEFLVRVSQDHKDIESVFLKLMKQHLPERTVEINNVTWIGAEAGSDIKWNALISILLSFFGILLYVAFRSEYRFAVGGVAALAHDLLAIMAVFIILHEQISLNLLAALLTTLGYSLNDTIVIFSRIKENMSIMRGQSETVIVNTSINQTLRRTLRTSATTLLAIVSILLFGGEALHSLSLAMFVGVIAGTYSSIYIASPVMMAIAPSRKE